MRFFYPNGGEIFDIDEFIRFYSRAYYYVSRDLDLEGKMDKLHREMGFLVKKTIGIFFYGKQEEKHSTRNQRLLMQEAKLLI